MNNTDKLRQDFESELINEFESDSRRRQYLVNLKDGDDYEVEWIEMRWRKCQIEAKDKELAELTKQRDNAIELIETFSGIPDSSDDLNLLINNVFEALQSKGVSTDVNREASLVKFKASIEEALKAGVSYETLRALTRIRLVR